MNNTLTKRKFQYSDGSGAYVKLILVNLALQLIAGIAVMIGAGSGADISVETNLVFMYVLQIANILVALQLLKKTDLSYNIKSVITKPKSAVKNIGLGAVAGAICVFAFFMLVVWMAMFFDAIGYTSLASLSLEKPSYIVITVIAACVFAPVGEELVYRGALLSGLKEKFGNKKFGNVAVILLSGIAFSLMHLNPEQTVYQFALGCVAAYLAIKANSVVPTIALHAVSNAFSFILELTQLGVWYNAFLNLVFDKLWVGALATVGFVVAGVAVIYLFGRLLTPKEKKVLPALATANIKTAVEDAEGNITLSTPVSDDKIADKIERHDVNALPDGGILGKHTGRIFYIAGIAFSLIMWVSTFVTSMGWLNLG